MKRTHTCNELRLADAGKEVSLIGWVDTLRDHGGVQFLDLRDREGITQIVFHPDNAELFKQAQSLRSESVVQVFGKVCPREEGTANKSLPTGDIEINCGKMIVHNVCEVLPFPLDDEQADKVNEDLRLQYRFLDLRRPRNNKLLRMRHKTAKAIRDYLDSQDFTEVETPALFKSTPEGAREFLVPSRLNPGSFYALSQSPQQYKQMLMVAGVERYYQMARCFRDEDLRADRQPEFTQVDIEL
ncbi:MAG: aspartate--tRNA ligase, partial [Opitutales bacterium]|nr:aspartate--tRNA ligase [Opitutales bacterium]